MNKKKIKVNEITPIELNLSSKTLLHIEFSDDVPYDDARKLSDVMINWVKDKDDPVMIVYGWNGQIKITKIERES